MEDKNEKRFKFSPKIVILFTVFLDVLGIGLIIPVLPYYVESFNVPDIVITLLVTVFSVFSFFSAPLLGKISDRKGRRPVLLVSLTSSAIGWLIFAFSKSIFGLFLGRIIDGAAAGNISTAQNYLIDISKDQKERTQNLGMIGAIFGIGFVVGPMLGGFLSNINTRLPFIAVGLMAILNTVLAYFFLPETHHHQDRNTDKISLNPFGPIIRAYKNKKVLPLFIAWLLFGIATSFNQSIFALYISKVFSWTVIASGLLMGMIGVIILLNQAFVLRKIWLKYFQESSVMVWLLLPFAFGYFVMSIPIKFAFILGLIITAFCNSTMHAVMNSQIVGFADKKEQGEMIGILASILSLASILGPFLGGVTYEIATFLPFIIPGIILSIAFVFVFRIYRHIKPIKHTDTEPVEAI